MEQTAHKVCFKCLESKPLTEFYRHPKMADGRLGKCKECTKKDMRENRADKADYYREYDRLRNQTPKRLQHLAANTRRWRNRNPERGRAQSLVAHAVRSGKITRQPCEGCGTTEHVHGHHEDYERPLDVQWLCARCHSQLHKQERETPA